MDFGDVALFAGLIVASYYAVRIVRALGRRRGGRATAAAAPNGIPPSLAEDARLLADELELFPSREQLEASERFHKAVGRLRELRLETDALIQLARSSNSWISRIALAVLAERDDLPPYWPSFVVRRLRTAAWDHAWLYLRTLERVPTR